MIGLNNATNMDIQSFLSDGFLLPISSRQLAAVARASSLFEESSKNSLNGLIAFSPNIAPLLSAILLKPNRHHSGR